MMEKFGRIIQIYERSIVFCILGATTADVDGLWSVYTNQLLQQTLQNDFHHSGLITKHKVEVAQITVTTDY